MVTKAEQIVNVQWCSDQNNVSPVPFIILSPPTDKITEGEFIKGVMDNKNILRLIQFDEPQKIKNRLKQKKQ